MSDPVIVNPSVVNTQLSAGVRQVAIFAAGIALSKFLPKETVEVLLSSDTINAVVSVVGIGAAIWGQYKTRKAKQTLVDAANAAPDSKFKVEAK